MNDKQPEVVLNLDHITKSWPDKAEPAIDDLSLTIRRGRIVGLLGPNGAGKTTLLSVLMGLTPADHGTIQLNGQKLDRTRQALRAIAGLVPQHIALYPSLSGRENLAFFAGLLWADAGKRRAMMDQGAQLADLGENLDRPVAHYSGGQKRRLNLAVGLLGEPELLFLDEPTVGIDPQSRNFILERIRQLREERGLTVVYTTHYMEEVEALCDDVAIIDRGRILLHSELATALAEARGVGQMRLRLAGPASASLLAELQAATATLSTADSRQLDLCLKEAGAPLSTLLALIEKDGNRVEDLRYGASLESLFLSLTGRALRD
ncbi:ABC transporter ATP-binding protein [Natronospira bacteriovora]|uniref:ABC transporter ATP-binding protein n=1 Tax=Natronospira bacteriovora TaxID=3069753 RepID=A0ABU0W7V9_9GAMM|nr:ABC transporter ATP-binding protein [Natronospira sp. AB-CW4]MDQ2069998.1 ABC transporter ATP-binding protein [Natronospira sp. AB-CW4]